MALCVNDSGTWRNITTLCVNDSGAWRNIAVGCINASGTWRKFSITGSPPTSVGCSYGGGRAICIQPTCFTGGGTVWIVAPNTSEVSRSWYSRNDANTRAQQVSGCTGWFVPSVEQLLNPGYTCRTYWDSYSSFPYWSSTESSSYSAFGVYFIYGNAGGFASKGFNRCVRAFRCVTY
jgi:hypothetical protein